jgi:FkbM family methyltransferase
MEETPRSSDPYVRFRYEGEQIEFWSVGNDHILRVMRRFRNFYERDVLERLRDRLRERGDSAVAIDVGAFIGTHSVYFAKFCGCNTVLSFEANPDTFPTLVHNIKINNLNETIVAKNKALGSSPGDARVVSAGANNQGMTYVQYDTKGSIRVVTLDYEVHTRAETTVALVKIDVEGAELEVLAGARQTIRKYRPILCVEIHKLRNLRKLLALLRKDRYWVIDCLGYSPTYIVEPTDALYFRRLFVNSLWLIRAVAPPGRIRWYLKRLAQVLSTGKWDVAPT